MHTLQRASEALIEELAAAFTASDGPRTLAAAQWLRTTGTPLVDIYETLLDAADQQFPDGVRTASDRLRMHDLQRRVSDLLTRITQPCRPTRGQVLVVVPGGSRNVLGTAPLEHLVGDAGFAVVSAPALELDDVEPLLADLPDPVALWLGLHDASLVPTARELLRRVRATYPRLRTVVGGRAGAQVGDLAGAVGAHAVARDVRSALVALGEGSNPLSPREMAVLQCVARGLSNPGAGQELGVAPATVKTHLDRVFAKLGTSDRTATVAIAMRRGWIS